MRYPAQETAERHDRIVTAAARLFRERGFDSVTVAEVMKRAGLTHGGFYAHFGSKEELAAAGLERALDEMLALADRAGAEADPRAAFVGRYMSREHRDHPDQGCAMATLAPEIARRPGAIRRTFTAKLGAFIERTARFPRRRGRGSARAEAIATTATLVGALVLARAVDDAAFSDEIVSAARARLGVPPEAA